MTPKGKSGGGSGRGQGGGGPVGNCVCPKCGITIPHQQGEPCVQKDCPKCGQKMTRQ